MRLDMKNIARNVPFSGLGHERLTPETQQGFGCAVGLGIGKDKRQGLAEIAPMRFPHLAATTTGSDLRQNLGFP
jgi:hypothetical protein